MRFSHMVRSARIIFRDQGPRSLIALGRHRALTLARGAAFLKTGAPGRTRVLQRLINARMEFDELFLRESDVARCDAAVLKSFVLHRYADAQNFLVQRVGQLDQIALLLVCDMLYRQWRYRDLMTISSTLRERLKAPDLLARADMMVRRAAMSSGALVESECNLAPLSHGTFAEFLLRGDVWNATGRMDLATAAYEQAIRMQSDNPMARLHYGFHLLKKGRLEEGFICWGLAERMFGLFPLKMRSPVWRGESLANRSLVIVFEHGFGDMIQFARYLKPLTERFPDARITGRVPAPIVGLLADAFPTVEFVSMLGQKTFDFHIAMTQLALVLGVPFYEPRRYIAFGPADLARRCSEKAAALRVGVCWRGHPRQYEQSRSVDIAQFASLFSIPNVAFKVLLNKVTPAEQSALTAFDNVALPPIRDFMDLAGLVQDCDVVVSVDTSIVHLAGAMGKPVILLSRPDACWRWGAAGTTSPWYDDMKIVRHPFDLDWVHVMGEARSLIETMAATLQHRLAGRQSAVA